MKYKLIVSASIQKLGNTPEENQDSLSVYPNKEGVSELKQLNIAISDGVTRASFSRVWSKLLTKAATKTKRVPSIELLHSLIEKSSHSWKEAIEELHLPWFAIEKAKEGSNATFLWFSLRISSNREYANLKALAVGDCELFILRKDKSSYLYPLKRASQFNSTPVSISSKYKLNQDVEIISQKINPGDEILVASDAIACYIMGELEAEQDPLHSLEILIDEMQNPDEAFALWVSDLRKTEKLRNDDSTLAWIRLSS